MSNEIEGLKTQVLTLNDELQTFDGITLIDDHGYLLNITAYPERIISLAPSNTEIVYAVGAGDKVVAVTDYCNYPLNFTSLVEKDKMSSVGSYRKPSIENIVALEPDLVIAAPGSLAAVDNLRNLGIDVIMLDPKSINDVLQNIVLVGRATGYNDEANQVVATMIEAMVKVNELEIADPKPKVYFEFWSDPLMSAGPETWVSELIELAGGQNILENATSTWPVTSSEVIIQMNPDYLLFPTSHGSNQFFGSIEDVIARLGWEEIGAVQNEQVYTIKSDIVFRAGPRLAEALDIIVEILHPE